MSLRNFNYYLFIFFGLVFNLFFFTFNFNQPKILGDSTSKSQSSERFTVDAKGVHIQTIKALDGSSCIRANLSANSSGFCEDNKGKHSDHCNNNNSSTFLVCDKQINRSGEITSTKCISATNNCYMGTKCTNSYCPNTYVDEPFWYSSVQSTDNSWCIDTSEAGHFCEDQTGKYFSFCQNNTFNDYKCKSGNEIDYDDDWGSVVSIGSTARNNTAKQPVGISCQKASHQICPSDSKCTTDRVKRGNSFLSDGGCAAPSDTVTALKTPTVGYSANNNLMTALDGTTCKILNGATACQDNSGIHTNFCSGSKSMKYFCGGKNEFQSKYLTVKCTAGEFPCSGSCGGAGICGQTDPSFPSPTTTPSKQCKSENAECQINNSGKECCEGLVCNGKCVALQIPTPTLELIPTTFNPTPHRGSYGTFWYSLFKRFNPNN